MCGARAYAACGRACMCGARACACGPNAAPPWGSTEAVLPWPWAKVLSQPMARGGKGTPARLLRKEKPQEEEGICKTRSSKT
jgi:hypothetical protein